MEFQKIYSLLEEIWMKIMTKTSSKPWEKTNDDFIKFIHLQESLIFQHIGQTHMQAYICIYLFTYI